jgi:hypothetical protein
MKVYSGAKELLCSEVEKKVSKLNRDLLNFLDSVRARQEASVDKLYDVMPPEYQNLIILSRYMDENDFSILRKMILDDTNDFKRDIISELEKYTIRLNLIQEHGNDEGNKGN